jgi:hypothetical protein
LLAENKDPYTMYYAPVGIGKEEYLNSVLRNDVIVTLISDDTEIINIPSWYFDNNPTSTVVSYMNLIIALNVGNVPTDIDIDNLTLGLEQYVLDKIGIKPVCELLSKNTKQPVPLSTHLALDFQRRMVINDSINIYARYRHQLNYTNQLMKHIKMLENYISQTTNQP